MATQARQLEILRSICDLPTAPYCEQHVIAWLLAWAEKQGKAIKVRRDGVGNVYLEYRRGKAAKTPLVVEAHMDHPGFWVTGQKRDGRVEAEFRGGVKPSHFEKAGVRFWVNDPVAVGNVKPIAVKGRWVKTRVEGVKQVKGERVLRVTLAAVKEKLSTGTLGMWDLPDAAVGGRGNEKGQVFAARVCDDLVGVAAIVCMLEGLIAGKVEAHLIGLCSRAEEVGFAGVLAVCERRWIRKGSPVIGLETSKASANAPQGGGPVIRVGDRTGVFSAGLTYFLSQTAVHIADEDGSFKYQRKLMDGGMCNSTAFLAWGYDSAAMCVALGNYHNMAIRGEAGWKAAAGGKTGKGIASETIHVGDFLGMVQILVEAGRRIGMYRPGFGVVKERLAKMHETEQKKMLWATSDRA